jgi:hypothetical protein
MAHIIRKGMEATFEVQLQKHGFKETSSGAYDLRDWDKIRTWTKDLAKESRK